MTRGKGEKKAKSRPSSSSVMDDAGPPLYVVLHYHTESIMCILQLKPPLNTHEHDAPHLTKKIERRNVRKTDYVERINFNDRQHGAINVDWLYAPPTSPNSFMYILPDHGSFGDHDRFPGYIYDIQTKEKQDIKFLPDSKGDGCVVSLKGQVYFMAGPDTFDPEPRRSFEYYNLDKGEWEPLQDYPLIYGRDNGHIQATAVWDDTILFNLDASSEFWAFNVAERKWYLVEVIDNAADFDNAAAEFRGKNRCYTIYGEAVVLEDTIYALTFLSKDAVLELSIERNVSDGAYKLSLVSILLPGLKSEFKYGDSLISSRHLVYMGEDNFCLVESCYLTYKDFQPIQLTSIKLEKEGEKSMTVTNSCLYEVKKEKKYQQGIFGVVLCFSLPHQLSESEVAVQ